MRRLLLALLTGVLLLGTATAAQASNNTAHGCTDYYPIGNNTSDRFCIDVDWHPQADGTGIVVDRVHVYPEICNGKYNNPSANIDYVSLNSTLRDGTGGQVWSKLNTTTNSACGRSWYPNDVVGMTDDVEPASPTGLHLPKPCIQGWSSLAPHPNNHSDPGYLFMSTGRQCRA
jgi:hypothetical protein